MPFPAEAFNLVVAATADGGQSKLRLTTNAIATYVGMVITSGSAGIPNNTTVVGIQGDLLTLSVNLTAAIAKDATVQLWRRF